jgi:glycosyltransferase involved in cell wall biosynthesis
VEHPLVSIVTPSFNQGRFIRATIESVFAQDYPDIEYIVMDGGSSDSTAEIVAEYGDRLTWISEPDRGQAHAINKGFQRARGEIVAWINSDDILFPGAVSRAVAALADHPNAGAVYGEGSLMDEEGRITGRFPATEPFNLWRLVHVWDYVLQQSVYFRKSVLEEVGYLDESLNWGLDWDLLIRIGCRYDLAYVPEQMGALREYSDAKSFSGGRRRFRELVRVLRHHGHHRYPPGYFLYGLDTYENMLGGLLRRVLPDELAARVRAMVRDRVVLDMEKRLLHPDGIYPGGWATRHVELMFPSSYRRLRLRGEIPALAELAGQHLTVRADGVELVSRALGFGDFELELELPRPGNRRPPLIVMEASHSAPGDVLKLPADRRWVSYLIRELRPLP